MAQVAETNSKLASENRFFRPPKKERRLVFQTIQPSIFAGPKCIKMLVSGRVNMSIPWHDILTGQESQAPSLCNSASLWCIRMLATTASREPTSTCPKGSRCFSGTTIRCPGSWWSKSKTKSSKEKIVATAMISALWTYFLRYQHIVFWAELCKISPILSDNCLCKSPMPRMKGV